MTRAQRRCMELVVAGAAGLALLCLTPAISAASSRVTRIKTGLTATSADPNAQGRAGLGIRGSDGTFDLKVNHLVGHATFDVVVRGVRVASLNTGSTGIGHLRFRSRPTAKELMLGFDPRGAQLSVRNASGNDVLVGVLPATTIDPTATACCIDDGNGGQACQALTPDACTAAGGNAQQAATCIPDPCAATPPPAATVCCTSETEDDESETECDDENATDCAAAGGMVVEAASCDANPCAPTPPPVGDEVACCVLDEDETECEVTTTETCTARNGSVMAGATCEPDPCVSGGPGDQGDDEGDDEDGGGGDGQGEHDGNGGSGGDD